MQTANRLATSFGSHLASFRHGDAHPANGRRVPSSWAAQPRVDRVQSRRAQARLAEIDQEIIRNAWDAELIVRERNAPRYALFPAQPGDGAVVMAAGGVLTSKFKTPVTIFRNQADE